MVTRRLMALVALATIAVQLTLTASGALVACANAQHTHNGVPARDCPMHHGHDAPASQPAGHEHHHHSAPASDAAAKLACGCSSGIPAFLIIGSAVVSSPLSVAQPSVTQVASPISSRTPLERSTSPNTPPPRPLSI